MTLLLDTPGQAFAPYREALVSLGERDPRVLVLGADLSASTEIDAFHARFPDRFINLGVAEQNAVGVAAGLALEGFVPMFHSFGVFTTRRPYEQVCVQVAMHDANVKLVGALPGLSSRLGPTHQAIDDLSLMRTLPNLTVIDPADATEMVQVLSAAASHDGPVYFRMMRREVPVLFSDSYRFEIGKAALLSSGPDVSLLSTGSMLASVLEAGRLLSAEGIHPTILHVPTIKPLDVESIITAAATGAIVTAENHLVTGGLGSAVAEALSEHRPTPLCRVGLRDTFASPGTPDYLLARYSMKAADIRLAALSVLGRSR